MKKIITIEGKIYQVSSKDFNEIELASISRDENKWTLLLDKVQKKYKTTGFVCGSFYY